MALGAELQNSGVYGASRIVFRRSAACPSASRAGACDDLAWLLAPSAGSGPFYDEEAEHHLNPKVWGVRGLGLRA